MRTEEDEAPPTGFRCAGAPGRELLSPSGVTVSPVDEDEVHLVSRWKVGRGVDANTFDAVTLSGLEDAAEQDQVVDERVNRQPAGLRGSASGIGRDCG